VTYCHEIFKALNQMALLSPSPQKFTWFVDYDVKKLEGRMMG